MHSINRVKMSFQARPENVGFARVAVACFASQRDDLTVDDIEDIKLVVSEAVSNAIIHGYSGDESQHVTVDRTLYDEGIEVLSKTMKGRRTRQSKRTCLYHSSRTHGHGHDSHGGAYDPV